MSPFLYLPVLFQFWFAMPKTEISWVFHFLNSISKIVLVFQQMFNSIEDCVGWELEPQNCSRRFSRLFFLNSVLLVYTLFVFLFKFHKNGPLIIYRQGGLVGAKKFDIFSFSARPCTQPPHLSHRTSANWVNVTHLPLSYDISCLSFIRCTYIYSTVTFRLRRIVNWKQTLI